MIGIFHVLMWYFLLVLYMGQIKGVFGTYEPITYKTRCALWGIIFIISGVTIIRAATHPTQRLVSCALIMNILCVITALIATVLTTIELSYFDSVSYRNYGQAKLGREVSRILLLSYPLEYFIACTYSIFGCIDLAGRSSKSRMSAPVLARLHAQRLQQPRTWPQPQRWNRAG
ncbi:membrane-spanning 4-domains subfamily A member 13 [Manis pentadactyla]|uniref:membrane-spanning 4-domains subfamily A member 13 n=1 Tax=Manis pentadactyla TaxID=143292 RepID=UPI00255D0E95|nr:membrane-spanning 4-domains subfamily A member 13 [Manis pentadactyla]